MSQPRTPGQQLLILLGFTACFMLLGQELARFIVMSFHQQDPGEVADVDPMLLLAAGAVSHFMSYIVVFFVFLRANEFSYRSIFPKEKFQVRILLVLPLVAVAGIFVTGILSNVGLQFFDYFGFYGVVETHLANQDLLKPLVVHTNPSQLFLSLLTLAVLPAIGEEFIYRGVLQSRLMLATQNIHFSVWISAVIFSAIHLQPVNLLAIALMGAMLGYFYAYTRNIWYSVLVHFLINALQLVQVYFWPDLFHSL